MKLKEKLKANLKVKETDKEAEKVKDNERIVKLKEKVKANLKVKETDKKTEKEKDNERIVKLKEKVKVNLKVNETDKEKEKDNERNIKLKDKNKEILKEKEIEKGIERVKGAKQNEKQKETVKNLEKGKETDRTTKEKECASNKTEKQKVNEMKDNQSSKKDKTVNENGNEKKNETVRNKEGEKAMNNGGNAEKTSRPTESEKQKKNGEVNRTVNTIEKNKLTIQDYQTKKCVRETEEVSSKISCDSEVDIILRDITNTYSFMQVRPITPVDLNGLQSCRCVRDDDETAKAVESIEKEMEHIKEKESEMLSEAACEITDESIINAELENLVEKVVQEQIENHSQGHESDVTVLERMTKKRKRDDMEDIVDEHILKRRVNGNNEYDEVIDELMETESIYKEDRDLMLLKQIQNNKVILNVGGARFETSRLTLRRDPESLLARLFTRESSVIPQGNTIFFDRDPSHFKIILNYLRYNLEINPALLPKERKYLLELKKECEYYSIKGLLKIVEQRLKYTTELNGMD